ncbi:MAG: glycosyltransferase family 2 protein [Oscillospiraceae bacterium]|jgi:glycosyltransferase involved in cell wall biosynthesis|nr:glycosyltransferase family 2 protein [Oscillospiraceae bacterium]
MKSNITDTKPILSVSMIVKNEEAHLEKCLAAIAPLLKAVRSELLITDTGSTDKTVQIAEKYADKVLHFDWCNDFSAARNFGLKECRGEWFMFLDADDVFDPEYMDEMIDFFRNEKLNKNYNSATYVTRNYNDSTCTSYNIFVQSRIFRRVVLLGNGVFSEVRFKGRVHEAVGPRPPCYNLRTYDWHTGYVFQDFAEEERKSKRNMELIKLDLADHPDDTRNLELAIRNEVNPDEKKKYVDLALSVKDLPEHQGKPYLFSLYHIVIIYYSRTDMKKSLQLTNEAIEKLGDAKDVILCEFYGLKCNALSSLGRFAETPEAYEKYRQLLAKYKAGELNVNLLRFINAAAIYDEGEQTLFSAAIASLRSLGECDKALLYWNDFGAIDKPIKEFRPLVNTIADLVNAGRAYQLARKIYDSLLKKGDKDQIVCFEGAIENIFYHSDEKQEFLAAFAGGTGRYFDLALLVKTQNESGEFLQKLQLFINETDWCKHFSEGIYLAIKYGADLSPLLRRIGHDETEHSLKLIALYHDDYGKLVTQNCLPENYDKSMTELFFLVTALEKAAYVPGDITDDEKHALYERFTLMLAIFVTNIYNPDALNGSDIAVFPPTHRFGYYMAAAYGAKRDGDGVGFIKGLSDALREFPELNAVVSALLDAAKKEYGLT